MAKIMYEGIITKKITPGQDLTVEDWEKIGLENVANEHAPIINVGFSETFLESLAITLAKVEEIGKENIVAISIEPHVYDNSDEVFKNI